MKLFVWLALAYCGVSLAIDLLMLGTGILPHAPTVGTIALDAAGCVIWAIFAIVTILTSDR